MTFTPLTPVTAELSAMRSLIPDTDAVFGDSGDENLFSDDELTNYYSVARGNLLRGAAYACMAIGSSEALISKKITEQDLATDGAAVAAAFLNNAKSLLARADADDLMDANSTFNIIDFDQAPKEAWWRGAQLIYPFGGEPTSLWD